MRIPSLHNILLLHTFVYETRVLCGEYLMNKFEIEKKHIENFELYQTSFHEL